MKKSYIRTIIFAFLFLSLLALVLWKGPEEGPHIHVLSLQLEAIQKVTVHGPDTTFYLERDGETWSFVRDDQRVTADNEKVRSEFYPLGHLDAESKLELDRIDADTWAPYGLKEPVYRVEILLGDGVSHHLLIGDRSPLQDHFYVRLDNVSAIYLISTYHLQPMLRWSIEDFTAPAEASTPPEAS